MSQETPEAVKEVIEPQAVVSQKPKTLVDEFGEKLQALLKEYPTIRMTVGQPPINIGEIVPAPSVSQAPNDELTDGK